MPWELVGRWFTFTARGHPNVRATHSTTFEVTTEDYLTPRGDCIIGVSAEVGAAGLPGWLRDGIRRGGLVVVVLEAGGEVDAVAGWGDPRLTLEDPARMVFRRSTYASPNTVMVRASKAARHLNRRLVEALRRGAELRVHITVVPRAGGAGAPGGAESQGPRGGG